MKGHGCKGLPGSNLWEVEMKRVESGYKKKEWKKNKTLHSTETKKIENVLRNGS